MGTSHQRRPFRKTWSKRGRPRVDVAHPLGARACVVGAFVMRKRDRPSNTPPQQPGVTTFSATECASAGRSASSPRRPNGSTNVVWIGVVLLTFAIIGCGQRSNEIEYRGERIKLTKAYADYHDYKNDPENIDPSETERVQRLVLSARIAKTFSSRLEASKAIGQVAFPGYGSGGFVEQSQADGSVLMGFFVEVPRANKDRYFVFHGKDGVYTLVDDFVRPDTAVSLRSVTRRGNDLVFTSSDGKEALVRPYVAK